MDSLLIHTQTVFDDCKLHLNDSRAEGTAIESYLTQHLVVIMCADIQQELHKILERRASRTGDIALQHYAVATCKKVLRSIGKNEIAGFAGYFGSEAKEYLNNHLTEQEISIYNNAVKARHNVAHNNGASITFQELDKAIVVAKKLITTLSDAISLDLED